MRQSTSRFEKRQKALLHMHRTGMELVLKCLRITCGVEGRFDKPFNDRIYVCSVEELCKFEEMTLQVLGSAT